MKPSESLNAALSLNRYINLIVTTKPTAEQAKEAVQLLCKVLGAKNEEDLLKHGDSDLVQRYKEFKEVLVK